MNENKTSTVTWKRTSSGSSDPKNYYFQQTGDKLTVEKFFQTTTMSTMLTFKKVDQ